MSLEVSQKTAWFMLHCIREAWELPGVAFAGPVEANETFIGQKETTKHASKHLHAGRAPVGKPAVVGAKDRASNKVTARVIQRTDRETLQGFVDDHAGPGARVYTPGATAYKGREPHEAVHHSVGEYIRGMAHANGVESFWAMLQRGCYAVYHRMSRKHLRRYVNELAGRHHLRERDTIDDIQAVVAGMVQQAPPLPGLDRIT